jgi:hypothetical protein
MSPKINASVTLNDFVRISENKVDALGGGWRATGPEPRPFGVLVTLKIELTDEARDVEWRLELEDESGRPAGVVGQDAQFSIGNILTIPSRAEAGVGVIDIQLPLVLPAIPFLPGDHALVLKLDGYTQFGWSAEFHVHAPAPVVAPTMATDSPIFVPGLNLN